MGESVTADIVEAIAEEEGGDPTELGFSLQNHVDTDALRLLMNHRSSSWTLSFDVEQYEVVVTGDGTVEVDSSRSEINA
jgi:hypothetical protein